MPDPFPPEWSVEGIATVAGVKVVMRQTVRFPVTYLATLMQIIDRRQMTGRLSIDYSQGAGAVVTWEGPK